MKEHMEFLTCGCDKENQTCIKTGFRFVHKQKGQPDTSMVGDLFLCPRCLALAIHGVPDTYGGMVTGQYCQSEYDGVLEYSKGSIGSWLKSTEDGIVRLRPADVLYVSRWHDLTRYERSYPKDGNA